MGLLSAAMLAELQKPNPQVYPLLKIVFPSVTKLWGSTAVNVQGVGAYDGRVTTWGGPFVRALSDRDGNLQTPSMRITVEDADLALSNILEGSDAHRLRGSQSLVTLVSPNVAPAGWPTILSGVFAGGQRKGLTAWELSCQYNDLPLRGFVPKTAFTPSDWPNADPSIFGTFVPIIYGYNSSVTFLGLDAGTNAGQVPLYLADTGGGTVPEYVVGLGWMFGVGSVYVNGTAISAATYAINHPVKNGRQFTTIKFTSSPPAATAAVTADVYGYESVGNGTGTILRGPSAFQHFLENFVFRDYQSGLWAAAGTYTDTTSFATAQAWASAVRTQFTARWIGGAQQVRGMDEMAGFLRSIQCHAFWTWGGKLGLLPFDLRDNTVWYDSPQWAYEPGGDIVTPLTVSYDYQSVMDRVAAQFLYGQAAGKYMSQLEVRDQALSESAPDSLQMPWCLAGNNDTTRPVVAAREAASYRLNRFRHPLMTIGAELPMWALDRELMDGFSWSHRLGPSSANMGPGWGKAKWQRRSTRIYSVGVDLDKRTVQVGSWDRRFIDCTLWDTMLTTRSVNSEAQGIPRILSGANRTYLRASKAWVEDPSDGTVREIQAIGATNVDAITAPGYLAESPATNFITRSAFKTAAGVGWTTTNGTITDDTTDTLWDTALTAQSRKIVSTSSAAAAAQMTHVTGAVGPTLVSPGGRFSMSYKNDVGAVAGFYYDIQRASDAAFLRDSDGTWQAGAQRNVVPISLGTKTRFVGTSPFVLASSSDTLTVFVTLAGGTSAGACTGHVYDAQIDDLSFATSRILTDGATVKREAAAVFYENFTTTRQSLWPSAKGTVGIEFVPDWTASSSIGNITQAMLLWQANDVAESEYWALYFDVVTKTFRFQSVAAGTSAVATSPSMASLVRGQRVRVVGRWTGTDGELGLANRTLSCFAATTSGTLAKGTDAVRAADPAQSSYGWVAAGGKPLAPTVGDFSGLRLWLNAGAGVYKDAGVTLAVNNDTVQQWSDQSGNGFNFIQAATSGPRPTYKTGIVNGQPVVRFSGAQFLATSSAALSTMLGTSGGGHMLIVFTPTSYVLNDPVLMEANTAAGIIMATTSGAGAVYNGPEAVNISGGVTYRSQFGNVAAGTWCCFEWIHYGTSGAAGFLYSALNGVKSAASSTGATDATGVVALGKRFDIAQFLTGDIAEVFILNAALTQTYLAGGLDEVQEYIQRKYGIGFNLAFASPVSPKPVVQNLKNANGAISRLRITPHVLADDELLRLFT